MDTFGLIWVSCRRRGDDAAQTLAALIGGGITDLTLADVGDLAVTGHALAVLGFRMTLQSLAGADGRLRLSFEIVYGHAFKAAPRPRPPPAASRRGPRPGRAAGARRVAR